MYLCVYVCMYDEQGLLTLAGVCGPHRGAALKVVCACMYVCMYVCVYVCIAMHVRTYVCVCMYVCMYVCIYIYIYMRVGA
jgi:hypothetical protein